MQRLLFMTITLALLAAIFCSGIYAVSYASVPRMQIKFQGDSTIVFDPDIGFRPRPNSRTHISGWPSPRRDLLTYDVYTDDRGGRVPHPATRSLAHADLVSLGSSNTWGHGIEAERAYTALAASSLSITAENLAFSSWGTLHAIQFIEKNRDLTPRLIVYGHINDHINRNVKRCAGSFWSICLDQSSITWTDSGPKLRRPVSDGARRAWLHSIAQTQGLDPLTWVTHGLDVTLGQVLWHAAIKEDGTDNATKERIQRHLFERMAATAATIKARLLVVFIPSDDLKAPRVVPAGIDFIDMTEPFRGKSAWISDDGHISALGHAMIADAIHDYWVSRMEPEAAVDHHARHAESIP